MAIILYIALLVY